MRIGVASMYGARTRQPLVALTIGDRKPICVTPEEARRVAALLYECAEAALGDGFLVGWLREKVGAGEAQGIALLREFRAYRNTRELAEQSGQEREQ